MSDGLKIILLTVVAMSAVIAFHMGQWIRITLVTTRRRSHRLCLACGYNLKGNVSGRCPECGSLRDDLPRRLLGRAL